MGAGGNISCSESQTGEGNLCKILKQGHKSTLWLWSKCFCDSVLKPDSKYEMGILEERFDRIFDLQQDCYNTVSPYCEKCLIKKKK